MRHLKQPSVALCPRSTQFAEWMGSKWTESRPRGHTPTEGGRERGISVPNSVTHTPNVEKELSVMHACKQSHACYKSKKWVPSSQCTKLRTHTHTHTYIYTQTFRSFLKRKLSPLKRRECQNRLSVKSSLGRISHLTTAVIGKTW